MSPLRIRNSRPEDLEEIYGIDQLCFPAHIAFTRREFGLYLDDDKSIGRVAEVNGRIAGFVIATITRRFLAHVITLDVVPGMRQHKVGTELMNSLHRELQRQRVRISVLEVDVENIAARRLYEKLNYEYQGLLRGYYRGKEDAFRMTRAIGRG